MDKQMEDNIREDRLNQDNADFFDALYRKYYDGLYVFVRSLLSREESRSAEDVVQDVFYEALCKAVLLETHPNPAGWLWETAKYKVMALKKKASTHEILIYDDTELDEPKVDINYERVEMNMVLEQTLNQHEREILECFYLKGYSVREMAEREQISEVNFKVKIHRLRKKLMENIGGLCILILLLGLH